MNNDTTGFTQAEERRRQRALKVQALSLEGFTQAEIAKRVGLTQRGVGKILARLTGGRQKPGKAVTRKARAVAAAAALGAPVAAPEAIRRRAPGAGRKPSGDGGERVRDYPPVMLRLPVPTLAKLKALAAVRGVPVWRLIDAAVLAYVGALKGAEAEDVRRLERRELERLKARYPDSGLP
jgi:alkylated DNA nucleotide flippase Atl1